MFPRTLTKKENIIIITTTTLTNFLSLKEGEKKVRLSEMTQHLAGIEVIWNLCTL